MLETNKQVLIFKFGEDLSYFVTLRYKLCDFIKIYDDYVNGPIKGDFQKTFSYYFISAGIIVSWHINGFGCIQHVKVARFTFHDRQTKGRYNVRLFTAMYVINNFYR